MTPPRSAWLLLFALALGPATCQAQPAPLNSSILILDERTLLRAPDLVARAAELGNKRLMFVVTMHCRLTHELRVRDHALQRNRGRDWGARDNYSMLTEERLDQFRDRLGEAFRAASERDLGIAILPHYDPVGEVTEWRNFYNFEPFEQNGGYSYVTSLIDPIIDALLESTTESTAIEFSLSGEMGQSLFTHPEAYLRLAEHVRLRLAGRSPRVGVAFNHSGVTGKLTPTQEQKRGMQRLLASCDFVAFSNYSPFDLPPSSANFAEDCQTFLDELGGLSVTLPEATPLQFAEIGLGGAPDQSGRVSKQSVAAEPWNGTKDPHRNPWATREMTRFRRDYHTALLKFLAEQPGPRRVEAAYLWSEGSWEPQGLDMPEFADQQIIDAIRRHNAGIGDAARDPQQPPAE